MVSVHKHIYPPFHKKQSSSYEFEYTLYLYLYSKVVFFKTDIGVGVTFFLR